MLLSELNDLEEQRKRMVEQAHARGESAKQLDDEFIDAIDQGMPPAGGLGIGVDPRHHPIPRSPRQSGLSVKIMKQQARPTEKSAAIFIPTDQ